MAQRWTFEEDYIVCKFCEEKDYNTVSGRYLDELMDRLADKGFNTRSKVAVEKRAHEFTCLGRGWGPPYATDQVKMVFQYAANNFYEDEYQQWIGRYVEEVYSPDADVDENESWLNNQNTVLNRLLIVEVPREEQSFCKVFNELLDKYYDNHKIGKKTLGAVKKEFRDKLVINYGVPGNTFDAIRREKNNTVSREHLFRLCFALELEYDEAKRLLNSVGYEFRRNVKAEVVIEAILKSNSHRRFIPYEINETLKKYADVRLFR